MGYGLWVMGYGLWVMGYGLWVMGHGLRVNGYWLWARVSCLLFGSGLKVQGGRCYLGDGDVELEEHGDLVLVAREVRALVDGRDNPLGAAEFERPRLLAGVCV